MTITIQGTPIDLPDSADSPNWAPGILAAFQAIELALSGLTSTGDISPTSYLMVSNVNTNVNIPDFQFSSTIRGADIRYAVYRSTTTTIASEKGTMQIVYNGDNPITNKWELTRTYVGDASVTFSISDGGQFSFSSTLIAGATHAGTIVFAAQALND